MKNSETNFQIKKPIAIHQPENLPEIEPFQDPIIPKMYPEESPIEVLQPDPVENPPYILPSPTEFKLNI